MVALTKMGTVLRIIFLGMFSLAIGLLGLLFQPTPTAAAACTDQLMYFSVRSGTQGTIYEFDASGSGSHTLIYTSAAGVQFDGIARDYEDCDQLWLISNNLAATIVKHQLYRLDYDGVSWVLTDVGATGIPTGTNADRLDIRPIDNALFALVGNRLYQINKATGAATLQAAAAVGDAWDNNSGGDIAFSPDGRLWGIRQNSFYEFTLPATFPGNFSTTLLCSDSDLNPAGGNHTGLGVNYHGTFSATWWDSATPTQTALVEINPLDAGGCQYNPARPGGPAYDYVLDPILLATDLTSASGTANPTAVTLFSVIAQNGQSSFMLMGALALILLLAAVTLWLRVAYKTN